MDKFAVYEDIHSRLINATKWGGTQEGALIIGVIGQACQDAMGMDGSQELVYIENNERGRKGRAKRQEITRQQEAIEWFRGKGHFPFADIVEIEPTWITWLLKTKAGVEI